jgi:energy-coupling factor transporter transmembrane protein EcfT
MLMIIMVFSRHYIIIMTIITIAIIIIIVIIIIIIRIIIFIIISIIIFIYVGESVSIWDDTRSSPLHSYKWGADSVLSVKFNPAESSLLASTGIVWKP